MVQHAKTIKRSRRMMVMGIMMYGCMYDDGGKEMKWGKRTKKKRIKQLHPK